MGKGTLFSPIICNFANIITSSHLKPSKIGDVVRAEAEVTKIDGKKIEFRIAAYSGDVLLGELEALYYDMSTKNYINESY